MNCNSSFGKWSTEEQNDKRVVGNPKYYGRAYSDPYLFQNYKYNQKSKINDVKYYATNQKLLKILNRSFRSDIGHAIDIRVLINLVPVHAHAIIAEWI